MKKILLSAMIIFGLIAGTVCASEIEFVDTYENALKVAGEQDKNILIKYDSDT